MINCPAVAAAATAIPSGYFIPAVLTNYRLYYLRSVPLLGLYCLTILTNLFRSTVSTTITITAVITVTAITTTAIISSLLLS